MTKQKTANGESKNNKESFRCKATRSSKKTAKSIGLWKQNAGGEINKAVTLTVLKILAIMVKKRTRNDTGILKPNSPFHNPFRKSK